MRVSLIMLVALLLLVILPACGATTERMENAQEAAPAPDSDFDEFRERNQIIIADYLSNRDDMFFWAYQLSEDGRLIDQWMCQGRPVSSTESIEPNLAEPVGMSRWRIDVDGHGAYTSEVMGIDGTYGDPVPYLYCITPEGHYEQWSFTDSVRVTTAPRVYPDPVVRVDESQVAKIETAKAIIAAGGCVDSNLNQIECSVVENNLGMSSPSTMPQLTPISPTPELISPGG
ncbi:MAG: hypothetical protein UZ22_OP11002000795 [Microgenomates bacterium OLB23]|nr:MAG: hypothetical protein UZ22_OP11002000795 [Microgenomates bacterium OLB23]